MSPSLSTADETVAALLTAPGPGAIAVIGVRGPLTKHVLSELTRRRKLESSPAFDEGRLQLCRVMDGAELLDEGLVVCWANGRRAELNVHGGVRIVERVLAGIERAGGRIVSADEFGSDEPDETCREVDSALLIAGTRRMTNWLLAQRRMLPGLMQSIETGAGGGASAGEGLVRRSRAAMNLLRGLRIAIVGPPNAGKSTLANRLIGHERVLTSPVPGTTRDWVSETATIQGWPVMLTDTAGVRAANDPLEREAIARGMTAARDVNLALVVLDATRSSAENEAAIRAIEPYLPPAVPRLCLLNKLDAATSPPNVADGGVAISALRGDGVEELEERIAARLGLDQLVDDAPALLTERQCRAAGVRW